MAVTSASCQLFTDKIVVFVQFLLHIVGSMVGMKVLANQYSCKKQGFWDGGILTDHRLDYGTGCSRIGNARQEIHDDNSLLNISGKGIKITGFLYNSLLWLVEDEGEVAPAAVLAVEHVGHEHTSTALVRGALTTLTRDLAVVVDLRRTVILPYKF